MALFDWTKEIKEEIKNAVASSVDMQKEVVRLQERVVRAEVDYKETITRIEAVLRSQRDEISGLRDRVAALEAQQQARHNDAMVIAAASAHRVVKGEPKRLDDDGNGRA